MAAFRTSERGFSLNELMLVIAVSGTMMAIAVPVMTDLGESTKLSSAARELERELQSARLKAVTSNQVLRVRLNCPAAGYYRTVEYLNGPEDSQTNRCLLGAYPFPAGDTDLMTRPNYDGPLRMLPHGATVTGDVLEFHPDGTAFRLVSNVATAITSPVTITVTRKGKSKAMTINGAGKIQLQQ
jgi:prepilin-type N-terminal cleavage/methylation domain-containing protein